MKKKQGTNNFDIIEELDANDQINLIGAKNKSISIQETIALGEDWNWYIRQRIT
jgi:hypothetical protein